MNKYYITFGQRWRLDPHPHGGHPDGWMELVLAADALNAHEVITQALGSDWSNVYTEADFTQIRRDFHPLGNLRTITPDARLGVPTYGPGDIRRALDARNIAHRCINYLEGSQREWLSPAEYAEALPRLTEIVIEELGKIERRK